MATTQTAAEAPDHGAGLIAAPLIVLGGGEHARVVIDAARSQGERWAVQGYAAPGPRADAILDVPWLGDDAAVAARLADLAPADRPWLVLGFGAGETPGALAARLATTERFTDARWATVVHTRAWVSPSATVEAGTVVLAGAVVNAGAHVVRHAIVNSAAVVEHDVVVGAGGTWRPERSSAAGRGSASTHSSVWAPGSATTSRSVPGPSSAWAPSSSRRSRPGATVVGIPARPYEPGS